MNGDIKATFDALQLLEQGEFQELGDELLPWTFPELRDLKPFGLTREGKTRKGVPDSFVGPSAANATAAVEYTTQEAALVAKLTGDFESVRDKCPAAQAIFLCTNRRVEEADVSSIHENAHRASINLEIVDGIRLATILSHDRQDLRQRFLKIPIGAHTLASLLTTLSETVDVATRGRSSSVTGRRFLPRFRLDVLCFERVRRNPRGTTLLLGDAGEGKTSWSIDYAGRFAAVQPTVWLHALDLPDGGADPLGAAIALAAYQAADAARVPELAALLRREKQNLLVFVDGADESQDYSRLERVLRAFRKSALGDLTHVILCCRTEAAEALQEVLAVFVPDLASEQGVLRIGPLRDDERRKLLTILGASAIEIRSIENALSPMQASNPLFIEMAFVLERAGALDPPGPDLIQRVADHFTADVCSRLRENGRVPSLARVERFFIALAEELSEKAVAAVDEDRVRELSHDVAAGENSLVSRALQTPLLNRTRAGLSFGHALFFEYFIQRGIIDRPERVLSLSRTMEGAERVASLVPLAPETSETTSLLRRVAEAQPIAACVLAARGSTDAAILNLAFKAIDDLFKSRFPSDIQRGINLLKGIRTDRARTAAAEWFNGLSEEGRRAWVFAAAELFFELEVPGAAEIVTLYFPFQSSWFEPRTVRRIDAMSDIFRSAMRQNARDKLETAEYENRVPYMNVLALFRDDFVIEYLNAEIERALLDDAAHHALVFLNTEAAIAVYARSVDRGLAAFQAARANGSSEEMIHRIWSAMIPRTSDLAMLPHDALVRHVRTLLAANDFDRVALGVEWSRILREGSLFVDCAHAIRRFPNSFIMATSSLGPVLSSLTEEEIRSVFAESDAQTQADIVHYVGDIPRPGLQGFLVERLAEKQHRFSAVQSLRRIGAVSAAPQIALLLDDEDERVRLMAARTLGILRYAPAVTRLAEMLESGEYHKEFREYDLIDALGTIGGAVAIGALERRYAKTQYPAEILAAILRIGSDVGVAAAERLTADAASWPLLVNAISRIGGRFGMGDALDGSGVPRHRQEPQVFIRSPTLLARVLETARARLQGPMPFVDKTLAAIATFDMAEATAFLREVASRPLLARGGLRRGDLQKFMDPASEARRLLVGKGDSQYTLALVQRDLECVFAGQWIGQHDIRRLADYPRTLVRRALHDSIVKGEHVARAVMILAHFVEAEDWPLLLQLEQNSDVNVADQAHQALAKLPKYKFNPSVK